MALKHIVRRTGGIPFRDTSGAVYNTYDPRATRITMDGNVITVSVQLFNNGFGNPSQGMDLPLGEFPPGDYSVQLVRRLPDGSSAGTVGSGRFSVSARSADEPLWNNTDLWWNPAESGWGLSLTQHGSGILFGAWFVYGADNKPIWYVMPNGAWATPTEYRGTVYRTTGPYLGTSTFDPTGVAVTVAGSATISFDPYDSTSATMVINVDGVTQTKSLRRQSF